MTVIWGRGRGEGERKEKREKGRGMLDFVGKNSVNLEGLGFNFKPFAPHMSVDSKALMSQLAFSLIG